MLNGFYLFVDLYLFDLVLYTPIKVGLRQFIDNEPFYIIAFLNTNSTV